MKKKYILIALCFLVIGFTAMSSILYINGSIKVALDQNEFEVVFSDAILDDVNVYASSISEDHKTINFVSNELKHVDDTSVLEYEIYNRSTQFVAQVSVECTGDNDYIRIDDSLGSADINPKEIKKSSLTITLLKVSSEVRDIPITCTLTAVASETSVAGNPSFETITLDPVGGLLETTSVNVELLSTYGNLPIPSKPGYGFVGWYDALEDGIVVTDNTVLNHQSPKTLYAIYEPGRFTVSFNADGGSSTSSSKLVTFNETYGELPIATKEGNVFVGWYTSPTGGSLVKASTTVNITGDTTLYARFVPESSMMISNTAGDYVQIGTRKFTLGEHNNVVLLRMYSPTDKTSGGYAIAASSTADLNGTGSGLETRIYTLDSGNTIYIGYMASPFSVRGSDPVTAYVGGNTSTITTWYDDTTDVLFEYLESLLY